MTIKLEFGEEETGDAMNAMQAGAMKMAAFDFDQRLRSILKYNMWPSDWDGLSSGEMVDKLRALHRDCWAEAGVAWDD